MNAATGGQGLAVQADQGGSIPTSPLHLRLQTVGQKVAKEFCRRHHYKGRVIAASHQIAFGIYAGEWWNPQMVGVMVFTVPSTRCEDQRETLELHRMVLLDECPRNSESRCIGVATRLIRTLRPSIRRLIAYSDLSVGHTGTIYKAAGWTFAGTVHARKSSWGGRWRNSGEHLPSEKLKWEKVLRG